MNVRRTNYNLKYVAQIKILNRYAVLVHDHYKHILTNQS